MCDNVRHGNGAFCNDLRGKVESKEASGKNFCMHNGALCYFPKKARRRRWVVPPSLRAILLQYYHDVFFAGHLGARNTFAKIASNFWWPGMREDVFKYVQGCELCQRAKPAQNPRVGLHSAEPSAQPLDRLFNDFVDPLVRTKMGNIAILVLVDAFSKFVALYPVRSITARVVLECLERTFFPAYGTPKSIVSDNARVFCHKSFKDLCFRWGFQHVTTTPYFPQGSLAERVKRNLKAALKIFHHESQNAWDEDLSRLSMAFNTAVHESTQFTPDILFLGREMKCPLAVRWDLGPVNSGQVDEGNPAFWIGAYENLKHASRKVASHYNQGRAPHQFKNGDLDRYRLKPVSSKVHVVSGKMMLKWSRSLVIVREVRPSVVLMANPDSVAIVTRAHVIHLKPCPGQSCLV